MRRILKLANYVLFQIWDFMYSAKYPENYVSIQLQEWCLLIYLF